MNAPPQLTDAALESIARGRADATVLKRTTDLTMDLHCTIRDLVADGARAAYLKGVQDGYAKAREESS